MRAVAVLLGSRTGLFAGTIEPEPSTMLFVASCILVVFLFVKRR
jgi:hypothetical protein